MFKAPKPKEKAKKNQDIVSPERETPTVMSPESEDFEDEEIPSGVSAVGSSSSSAEALAAASNPSSEMSASFKNFRHHPDMENFYRFIFENDLRHEALAILDEVMVDRTQKKLNAAKKP